MSNNKKRAGVGAYTNSEMKHLSEWESVSGRMPIKYTSAYPVFMKPAKPHAYRRTNDTHVEKVMQDAIKRVENQIQAREYEACDGTLM